MSGPEFDSDTWSRVEDLFHQALEHDAEDRPAWLAEACGEDADLRARIDALLEADSDAGRFFDSDPELDTQPVFDSPGELTGKSIGGFRLLRLIARGGMGSVYEAEQDEPRRTVALKILHRAFDDEWRRRFRLEARILAHLRHPGIAHVHDAGIEAGIPWFAMEFIEGTAVTRFARDAGLDVKARLELFALICDAIHHAHQKGVIHRDLKPANILVDGDGHPRIVDFGLARALTDDIESSVFETNEGVIFGTLPYMSPEQSGAGDELVDVRSDVYALGAVLYELLADRPAFIMRDAPLHDRLDMIRNRMPPRLGSLHAELDGDVEVIVEKAMDKAADRRYPSASELAADVRRVLTHEPILARAPSATYQLAKFARRHRALVTAGAAAIVVLIGFSITVTRLLIDARESAAAEREAKQKESAERKRAEDALDEAALVNRALQRVFSSASAEGGRPHDVKVVDLLDNWRAAIVRNFAGRPAAGLSTMRLLGTMYRGVGRYDAALEILEETAATARRELGPEHQETLATLTELAIVQEVRGLLARAEHNARAVHEARQRLEPGGHRDSYRNLAVLAKILTHRHRYTEAEEIIRGLDHDVDANGPETIRLALAHICEVTGRLDEAADILAEIDRDLVAAYGDNPSVFVGVRCQEASVAVARGDFDRGLTIARDALELSREYRGPDHRQTIEIEQMVVTATVCTGELRRAIELGTALVKRCDELFGERHEQSVRARTSLAIACYRLNRLTAASEILDVALAAADECLPPLDPVRLRCIEYMIRIHLARNRNELATEIGDELIQLLDASDQPVTAQGISVRRAVAAALQRSDEFEEAIEVLERAESLMATVKGFEDGERLRVLNDLAAVHYVSGTLDEAERVMRRVFDLRVEQLGEEHPQTVTAMNNLGMVLLRRESFEEAQRLLERSYELVSSPGRDETLDVGAYAFGLAECLLARQRFDEAERLFERALAVFERLDSDDNRMRRATWKLLVKLYDAQGRTEDAARYRKLLARD